MNAYADHVVRYLQAQGWQVALLAVIVGLACLALRNRSAHVRYLLWLIVLAKCLVPPVLTVPLAVLPEQPPASFVPDVVESEELPAAEIFAPIESASPERDVKRASLGVREGIALVWAAGVVLFLLWVGGRAVRYTGWLHDRRKPLPPDLQQSIRELSRDFRFRRRPKVWLLSDIGQPFVWGLLRGSIYLPADFAGLPRSDQRRSILAHELSHVARFDAAVNLIQVIAQALYWFHPLVWWANQKIRREREECCDEMAVARLSTSPEHYTDAIVDALAAERRSGHPVSSLAVVGSVRDIEERIRTMLKPGKTFRTRPTLAAATVASLIALVTIPTALVLTARAQTPPVAPPAADTEKVEQPRYAARTFNSTMAFRVSARETSSMDSMKQVGNTPSGAPLQIPPCWLWFVTPSAPVKDWGALASEMTLNNIPGLAVMSCTDSDLKYLEDLKDLRFLMLGPGPITDAGLEHLKGLTGLEELHVVGNRVTDAGLVHIKDLTGLRELNVTGARITDAGLANLKNLTGLRSLSLSYTGITDAGLQHLTGLTGLDHLNLNNTQVTDAGIQQLKQSLPKLTVTRDQPQPTAQDTSQPTRPAAQPAASSAGPGQPYAARTFNSTLAFDVFVQEGTGTEGAPPFVGRTPGPAPVQIRANIMWWVRPTAPVTDWKALLREIEQNKVPGLRLVSVEDSDTQPLTDFKSLKGLWLQGGGKLTDAGLAPLEGLTGLEVLRIQRANIMGPGLAHIEGMTGLQVLTLNITTDESLSHVKGLTQLQSLSVGSPATDAGMEYLKGLTELRRLSLYGSRVTDAGLVNLKGLSKVQVLNLAFTKITDAGMTDLAALSSLSRLFLDATGVTDAGLARLGSKTNFKRLNLSYNKITDAGLVYLEPQKSMNWLDLSNTQITGDGLVHLKGMTQMLRLFLANTQVTDESLANLEGMTRLRSLNLFGTQVTDAGLVHLKGLTSLGSLNAPATGVTDAGIQQLKQSLPKLTVTRNATPWVTQNAGNAG